MTTIPGFDYLWSIIIILVSFSALIFVHEFGHYLLCRLTGVRVERFFLGFDAWGLGLSRKIGGTVYGIGIIPLGGYVKPAGQSDTPEEQHLTGAPDELPSKPLWAQAGVFVAGVVMNFIFGYVLLVCAYLYGIDFIPPVVGKLTPDSQAARHGIQTGDYIISINGDPTANFTDVQQMIFKHWDEELDVKLRRTLPDGGTEVLEKRLTALPNEALRGKIKQIDIFPMQTRKILAIKPDLEFAEWGEKLARGDEIVAVNGVEIGENEGQKIGEILEKLPGETARLTVRHPNGATETVSLPVPAATMELDIGLRYGIYLGQAPFPGSAAADAGLVKGDTIECFLVDGKPAYIPNQLFFRKQVTASAFNPVSVTVVRDGKTIVMEGVKPLPLIGDSRFRRGENTYLGAKGAWHGTDGFQVTEKLDDASPLQVGDLITALGGAPLDAKLPLGQQVFDASAKELVFRVKSESGAARTVSLKPHMDGERGLPMIGILLELSAVTAIERGPYTPTQLEDLIKPGTRVYLVTVSADLQTMTIVLGDAKARAKTQSDIAAALLGQQPDDGTHVYLLKTPRRLVESLPARLEAGMTGVSLAQLRPMQHLDRAPDLTTAMTSAGTAWVDMAGMIYRTIHRLATRKLRLDAVGGPVMMFDAIDNVATDYGYGYLMYFIAMISINLAIVNLLPFPVLDGGHLLFLFIHWLKGSPPSERVKEIAQYVGLVCILALIVTVTFYDVRSWLLK